MAKTDKQQNPHRINRRVWIELEVPADEVQARQIAELANNMLQRLAGGAERESKFWWDSKDQRWCFGGQMGYHTLSDNGTWFNLDYLGRPL